MQMGQTLAFLHWSWPHQYVKVKAHQCMYLVTSERKQCTRRQGDWRFGCFSIIHITTSFIEYVSSLCSIIQILYDVECDSSVRFPQVECM